MLTTMDKELEYLESRVSALIGRVRELETQNSRFALALSEALKENAELNYRVTETRNRLATLIGRLPEEVEEDQ